MVKKRQGNSFEDRPKFRMAFVAGFRDRVLIPLENIGKGGTSLAGGNKISSSPPPPASSQRAVHVCLFLFFLSLSLSLSFSFRFAACSRGIPLVRFQVGSTEKSRRTGGVGRFSGELPTRVDVLLGTRVDSPDGKKERSSQLLKRRNRN